MKKIILTRGNENLNQKFPYDIYASGSKKIGQIRNNETLELEVSEDIRFLQIKLLWCGSKRIITNSHQNEFYFTIKTNHFLNKYMPFSGALLPIIGIGCNYIFTNKYIIICLMTTYILGIVSTLTIFKNRWIYCEPYVD